MWNAKQHSYEELRDTMLDVLLQRTGGNQFLTLVEQTARVVNQREQPSINLGTGMDYQGASAALHPNDRDLLVEIFWDFFRQGVITLGLNDSNPNWPFFRLSRFGQTEAAHQPYRFHDTTSYVAMVTKAAHDLLPVTKLYLDEAAAAFYSGCLLSATVMLGVAAEAEFLRLVQIANDNPVLGKSFEGAVKQKFIRSKIEAFRKALGPHLKAFPPVAVEDLDINLNAVQSILRIARNGAGHPSGAAPPSREQVYVNLQLFAPFALQVKRLREHLAQHDPLAVKDPP